MNWQAAVSLAVAALAAGWVLRWAQARKNSKVPTFAVVETKTDEEKKLTVSLADSD